MLVTPGVKGSKLELTVKFNIQRGRFTTKKNNDSDNNVTITLSSLQQISPHREVAFYKLVVQFSHIANKALFTSMGQRGIARV